MRKLLNAVAIALAAPTAIAATGVAAHAETPAPAPAATGLSVENTDLGTLLDNPAAKAILAKHIPDVVNNEQIDMGRSMTLRQLQQYAADSLTDDALTKIQADLDKLPRK